LKDLETQAEQDRHTIVQATAIVVAAGERATARMCLFKHESQQLDDIERADRDDPQQVRRDSPSYSASGRR
jgi:hypothetical protein